MHDLDLRGLIRALEDDIQAVGPEPQGPTEDAEVFHMKTDLSPGFGYTGVVIAMVGALSPIGVVLASFLMAVIVQGTQAMHRATGVPWALAETIQGIILLCLLVGLFFTKYRVKLRMR